MARTDIIHGDRRSERRYAVEIPLRYSYSQKGVAYLGAGSVADLSRSGVRFVTDCPPPDGLDIELRLAWPFLLQNVCPLELIIRGKVMKTEARGTIVALEHYEFRTCGPRSFDQASAKAAVCSIMA
ncbi:MAG TPA: PilZ domain-containing protein [Verrucomicrobiae bacterium]|nr:PilZ domain-containing protein [Verrucomicrobiae bacterium]